MRAFFLSINQIDLDFLAIIFGELKNNWQIDISRSGFLCIYNMFRYLGGETHLFQGFVPADPQIMQLLGQTTLFID